MMSKFWLIAQYEYKRLVLRRSFIFALLSVPIMIALFVGVVYLAISLENDYTPVGYVDHSGLLAHPVPIPASDSDKTVPILPFPSEGEARKALEAGKLQAYYVLPADYVETNQVELVYVNSPSDNATQAFWDFMQMNWLADQPPEIARRVATMSGDDVVARTPDGSREFRAEPTLGQLLPILSGLAFMLLLSFSAGYLVQVVAEEKENRTMEIVVSSASPGQLIGGKVLGIFGVTFTQVVAWTAFIALAAFVGGNVLGVAFLQDAGVDARTALLLLAVFVPAYVMYSALMAAMGATVAEAQEAQQVTGMFILPNVVPLWLIAVLMENPNNPLSIGLTLFPLTSPATIAIRVTFGQVPLWQAVAAIALLVLSALGAIWLAGRAFRLGMLRYGKRVSLRELFARPSAVTAGGSHE